MRGRNFGATITGDGVTAMFSERLAHYTPYFKNNTPVEEAPLEEALGKLQKKPLLHIKLNLWQRKTNLEKPTFSS